MKSMHGEVQSRVALLVAQAEASTAHVVDVLSKRVSEVAAQSEVQASHIVGTVAQRLEKDIEAAVVRAVVTSERHTRSVVHGLREEVKAHMVQTRSDLERKQEKMQHSVAQMAAGLEELTKQLNTFKPASAKAVGSLQENLSKEVAQKVAMSEQRISGLSQSVENQKKSVEDTNELPKDLMMGIENMSDNMKLIQKEMNFWRNPEVQEAEEEYAHLQEELQQEVPLFVPASKGPENTPISSPEGANSFPAQRQNIFPVGGLEGIPATSSAQ